MKKFLVVVIMPLLIACGLKGTNENGNIDADMETYGAGKACVEGDPGGIKLCDNLTEGQWEIRNLSDTAVHLTCTVTDRKFIFIDQYYLTAQASEKVPDSGMNVGDVAKCDLWFGYFEGPINRIFKDRPDFTFSFVYERKSLMKLLTSNQNTVARISLPDVKGVVATMASSYTVDPDNNAITGLEEGTDIAVVNGSSDWVDYQVYSAKSTSETDVRVDFEMCKVTMIVDNEDICTPHNAIDQGTIIILVVRAHDVSNGTWTTSDYEIVKIDLLKQVAKVLDKSALHGGLP